MHHRHVILLSLLAAALLALAVVAAMQAAAPEAPVQAGATLAFGMVLWVRAFLRVCRVRRLKELNPIARRFVVGLLGVAGLIAVAIAVAFLL